MIALRILGLDTSGKTAAAAILDTAQGLLLAEHTVSTSRTHSQVILPMCKVLLEECGMTAADVDCYAVAVGPGSYTGLRIGIAAVQGMAMVRNTPCVGVSTLEGFAARLPYAPLVLSVMHAREQFYYAAAYRQQGVVRECILPDGLYEATALEEIVRQRPVVTGEGAAKLAEAYDITLSPPMLRMQSAAAVCSVAAEKTPDTPAALTASYLQMVQIQKAAAHSPVK